MYKLYFLNKIGSGRNIFLVHLNHLYLICLQYVKFQISFSHEKKKNVYRQYNHTDCPIEAICTDKNTNIINSLNGYTSS